MSFRATVLGGRNAPKTCRSQSQEAQGSEGSGDLTGTVVPRAETRRGDTGDQDRHRLIDQRAVVTFEGDRHTVELINLSGGGAMIAATSNRGCGTGSSLSLARRTLARMRGALAQRRPIGPRIRARNPARLRSRRTCRCVARRHPAELPRQEVHLRRPEPASLRTGQMKNSMILATAIPVGIP